MTTEDLMARLLARYGAAFREAGRDPEDVRREWEATLGKLTPRMVDNALAHLPALPVSAFGFYALAVMHTPTEHRAPRAPLPPVPPPSEAKRKALARLAELREEYTKGRRQ